MTGAGALSIGSSPIFNSRRERVAALAVRHALPTRRLNLLSVTKKRAVVPRSARFCFRPPNGQIAAPLRLSKKWLGYPKNTQRNRSVTVLG